MEHIIISPGKLKLMLTKSDLSKYELDCTTLDSEDVKTRRAFRDLLSDVGRASGFDTSDDKLFIQLYPSKDGGAEIYITKLTAKPYPAEGKTVITSVYRFDSFDSLADVCARARACGSLSDTDSSAWYGDDAYFLIISKEMSAKERLRASSSRDPLLSSYGTHLGTSPAISAFVREHFSCFITEEAAALLAELA